MYKLEDLNLSGTSVSGSSFERRRLCALKLQAGYIYYSVGSRKNNLVSLGIQE
jgi:hypothetical protein